MTAATQARMQTLLPWLPTTTTHWLPAQRAQRAQQQESLAVVAAALTLAVPIMSVVAAVMAARGTCVCLRRWARLLGPTGRSLSPQCRVYGP